MVGFRVHGHIYIYMQYFSGAYISLLITCSSHIRQAIITNTSPVKRCKLIVSSRYMYSYMVVDW